LFSIILSWEYSSQLLDEEMNPLLIMGPYWMLGLGSYSSHQIQRRVWKLGFVNRLVERSEPDDGVVREPEPMRKDLSQLSPEEMLLSCML
jgi:hypothetical protein